MKLKKKKKQKIRKNEKTQHLIRCFKSKKQFKFFRIFVNFSPFWVQSGKKQVFCDFLKKYECWSKFDITNVFLVKLPFWKCILLITSMNSLTLI